MQNAVPTPVPSTDYQRAPGAHADRVMMGESLIVERHGRPIFAVLPIAVYDRLCEAASRADTNPRGIDAVVSEFADTVEAVTA